METCWGVTGMDAYSLGARIRRKRKELGKTLQQVADESRFSIGFLSRVERNDVSPSLSSLAIIANVLQSDMESFVSVPSNAGSVILAEDRAGFSLPDGKAHYQQLSSDFPGKRINGVEVLLEPGFQTEAMVHEGEELCVVLDGQLTLTLNNKTQVLTSGDSAHYSATIPHQWRNTHTTPCRVMWFGDLDIFAHHKEE